MREPAGVDRASYLNSVEAYRAEYGIAPDIRENRTHEQYFIVGCGKDHRHSVQKYIRGSSAEELMASNHCYTIDINPAAHPHRVGSFWTLDHTEDIPSNTFERVVFEHSPAIFFQNPGWCLVGLRTAFRLLQQNGWVVISTAGMQQGTVAGDNIREALNKIGFINTTDVLDSHNFVTSIWAQKP